MVPLAIPTLGWSKAAIMAAKVLGAKLQIAIQLGDDVKGLTIQGRQAGVKGVHYSGPQLAAAGPPVLELARARFEGGPRGVAGDDLGGSVPAAVVDDEPEVGPHGWIDDGVQGEPHKLLFIANRD